jgi:hypothetical protein
MVRWSASRCRASCRIVLTVGLHLNSSRVVRADYNLRLGVTHQCGEIRQLRWRAYLVS